MPFRQLLKSPYQYFKNRNGIFCELQLNLRWEQWSNILIWQLFENLSKIKYFLAWYVYQSFGPTIKIILSVQDNFCWTFATVRRTFGMTAVYLYKSISILCDMTNFTPGYWSFKLLYFGDKFTVYHNFMKLIWLRIKTRCISRSRGHCIFRFCMLYKVVLQ